MNNSTSEDIYNYIYDISLMCYELESEEKHHGYFDCRVLVGIHNYSQHVDPLRKYRFMEKNKKSSKAVGENKTHEKTHTFEIISFSLEKKK